MSAGGPYKIGQKFGPYALEAYLGSGGFKSVYRAANHGGKATGDKVVALGFPHQQDAEGLAELEKEFQVCSRLLHPNILRVYAMERFENVSFIVMEYLEGVSLRKKLTQEKTLTSAEAVRCIGLVAEALAFAHSAHVLHRDVKPENVFITVNKAPKLLDFGVARLLARTSAKASTRIGTLEYMAPEQLQGAAGANSDLWALGIMFYELLTGRRPFVGEMGEIIKKIMTVKYDEAPLREKQVDNRIVRVLRKMLYKDPEGRYQRAEDLIKDLETAARRTRLVDDDESRLEVLIRASIPLVLVMSYEEDRVLRAIRAIAERLSEDRGKKRGLYIWSASRGLRDENDQVVLQNSFKDPTAALDHVIENPEDAVYVFLDMHHHFTPVTTRLIRDAARAVRMTRKSLLFLSPFYQAPEELQKEMSLAVFHLPDREQFEPLLEQVMEECRLEQMPVQLEETDRQALIRAVAGLTLTEAERAVRKGMYQRGGLTAGVERDVVEEKTQVIRKTGILEYYHQSESFADVGGLARLLGWFNARAPIFAGAGRYAGLPQPKGVLLVGVPGCGKSLSARALAGGWRVPLLRLDVGRIFGPLVGEAEANLRKAIQTAEAVSPCVLWIDEVEKGFAGAQSQSGGGVSARVFGSFLSWLQDKKSPVFVVATANDLSGIPPEFLRKGRFDEIFFVGLPDKPQRQEILKIHLQRRKRKADAFDLKKIADKSELFSGAELEQAVVEGLFRAFEAGREVQTKDVLAAAEDTFPLARSRANEIAQLIQWAEVNAVPAN